MDQEIDKEVYVLDLIEAVAKEMEEKRAVKEIDEKFAVNQSGSFAVNVIQHSSGYGVSPWGRSDAVNLIHDTNGSVANTQESAGADNVTHNFRASIANTQGSLGAVNVIVADNDASKNVMIQQSKKSSGYFLRDGIGSQPVKHSVFPSRKLNEQDVHHNNFNMASLENAPIAYGNESIGFKPMPGPSTSLYLDNNFFQTRMSDSPVEYSASALRTLNEHDVNRINISEPSTEFTSESFDEGFLSLSPLPETSRGATLPNSVVEPNRNVHRELLCAFCGKTFDWPSRLSTHLRSHTGEKPFKCKICGTSFTQKYILNTHIKIHGEPGKDVYWCCFCNIPFAKQYTCGKHEEKCLLRLDRNTPHT